MRRVRPKIGDVFTVPLDHDLVGFGQVVAKYLRDGYYFAIFEETGSRSALRNTSDVVVDHVAFLALSFDAKIAVGDW